MRFPPRYWRIPIALALVVLSLISIHSDVRAQLDPITDPISFGPVRVGIQIVAVLPDSHDPRGRPRESRPNLLTHAGDGSGRIFVNEMGGQIYVLQDDQLLPNPFLDLINVIGKRFRWRGLEIGLHSFAFHPNYARADFPGFGKIFTLHTENGDSQPQSPDVRVLRGPSANTSHFDVLTEWQVSADDPNRIETSSAREILRIVQPRRDHNAGLIAFNPNARPGDDDFGLLYIGVGDPRAPRETRAIRHRSRSPPCGQPTSPCPPRRKYRQ